MGPNMQPNPDPNWSDPDLAAAWAAGHRRAYEILVERHHATVRARCRRDLPSDEADDATQQVFLVLHDRAAVAAESRHLPAWLATVASNVTRNARRCRARRQRAEQAAAAEWQRLAPGDEHDADLDRLDQLLGECLASLPTAEREVVHQHYFAGRSYREIAKGSSIAIGTVAARMRRAVDTLRRDFARRGVPIGSVLLLMLLRSRAAAAEPVPSPAARATATAGAAVHSPWPAGTNWIMKTTAIAAASLVMASATIFTIRTNGAEGTPPPPEAEPPPALTRLEAPPAADAIVGTVMVVEAADLGAVWDDFLASDLGGLLPPDLVAASPLQALGGFHAVTYQDLRGLEHRIAARQYEIQREMRSTTDLDRLAALTRESLALAQEGGALPDAAVDWSLQWDASAEEAADAIVAVLERLEVEAGDEVELVVETEQGPEQQDSHWTLQMLGMDPTARFELERERGRVIGGTADAVPAMIRADARLMHPAADEATVVMVGYELADDGAGNLGYWEQSRISAWMGEQGLRMRARNPFLDAAEAERIAGYATVDRTLLERAPDSAIACAIVPLSEGLGASMTASYIEGLAVGNEIDSALRERMYRLVGALHATAGDLLLYLDQQPMLPAATAILPCSAAQGTELIAVIAELSGSTPVDGRLEIPLGPAVLQIGWVDGELRATTHHLGLAAAAPPAASLAAAADVRAALAKLPLASEHTLVLVRPEAILEQVAPLVAMSGDPDATAALERYREALSDGAPAHYLQVGVDDNGWAMEADGIVAACSTLIAGAASGAQMNEILQ